MHLKLCKRSTRVDRQPTADHNIWKRPPQCREWIDHLADHLLRERVALAGGCGHRGLAEHVRGPEAEGRARPVCEPTPTWGLPSLVAAAPWR